MNAPMGPLHAVYAPSSAHRWTVCTASASAIAALGELEEGDEAKEGTAAHEEIDAGLGQFNGAFVDTPNAPDAEWPMANPAHPAAHGIALVFVYVRGLPSGKLWIEQRVRLTDQIWGRCDVAHWHAESRTLTIIDYKNGFVGVDAEENEQLRIYAAASIFTHNLPALWIRYAVVQPNDFRPVPRVKQWIESAADLYAFAERVAAIPTGPLTFVAGEQCKYCPLFGRCPASQDVLVRLGTAMASAPEDVLPGQVALFKAMEKPVNDWFKALDKVHTKAALGGRVPAGMKLVQTQKHRAWKDERQARLDVFAALGVDALSPPTPAQAEKLGIAAELVAEWSERPEGGPALAFESDKRPTWAPKSAEKMFGAVAAGAGK